jgi:hypothetical protein
MGFPWNLRNRRLAAERWLDASDVATYSLFQFLEQNLPDDGHSARAQPALGLWDQTWTVWRVVLTSPADEVRQAWELSRK